MVYNYSTEVYNYSTQLGIQLQYRGKNYSIWVYNHGTNQFQSNHCSSLSQFLIVAVNVLSLNITASKQWYRVMYFIFYRYRNFPFVISVQILKSIFPLPGGLRGKDASISCPGWTAFVFLSSMGIRTIPNKSARIQMVQFMLNSGVQGLPIAWNTLASFPGHRQNGMATSASSNCYFRCQKVGRTLSHDNSKTQLHHALNCCNHAHSFSTVITRLHQYRSSAR